MFALVSLKPSTDLYSPVIVFLNCLKFRGVFLFGRVRFCLRWKFCRRPYPLGVAALRNPEFSYCSAEIDPPHYPPRSSQHPPNLAQLATHFHPCEINAKPPFPIFLIFVIFFLFLLIFIRPIRPPPPIRYICISGVPFSFFAPFLLRKHSPIVYVCASSVIFTSRNWKRPSCVWEIQIGVIVNTHLPKSSPSCIGIQVFAHSSQGFAKLILKCLGLD